MKYKENEHYELTPAQEEESWNVRYLTGYYTETVIKIGSIKIDGVENNEQPRLYFEYDIISSPIENLETNEEMDNMVGDTITSIIESAIDNEEILLKDL